VIEPLLPLSGERNGHPERSWDYLYEPDAQTVIDELLVRYVEALIYQESRKHGFRAVGALVAMKAATDNAAA